MNALAIAAIANLVSKATELIGKTVDLVKAIKRKTVSAAKRRRRWFKDKKTGAAIVAAVFVVTASSCGGPLSNLSKQDIVDLCDAMAPCEDCDDGAIPPVVPPVVPDKPAVESFSVTPGVNYERTVKVPGSVKFTVTPIDVASFADANKAYIFWAYNGKFTGGRGAEDVEFGLRTYKSKAMWKERGKVKSHEPRYAPPWSNGVPVNVEIAWSRTGFAMDIGGQTIGTEMPLPKTITVGLGWPPEARPGVAAIISGVEYE